MYTETVLEFATCSSSETLSGIQLSNPLVNLSKVFELLPPVQDRTGFAGDGRFGGDE